MRAIKFILYVSILILVSACNDFSNKNSKKKSVFKFPEIIDTLNTQNLKLTSINWLNREPEHNPHYFGKICDSIVIRRNLNPMPPPPPPPGSNSSNWSYTPRKIIFEKYFREWMSNHNFKSADSINLSIKIDTTQIINKNNREAFPVLIQNKSIDTIYIGYGEHIPIITEAKTKKGIWKPIEKKFSYKCGMGIFSIILPPKELVITSQLIYSGDFKTKMRIKLGNNYSTEFYGEIKELQFLEQWDEKRKKIAQQ